MTKNAPDCFAHRLAARLPPRRPLRALEAGAGRVTLPTTPGSESRAGVAHSLHFDHIRGQLAKTVRVTGNVRRVLQPGGYFIAGVPIYMPPPTDKDHTTQTHARQALAYKANVYRISEQAVREAFFEGYSSVTDEVRVRQNPNPYMTAAGRK